MFHKTEKKPESTIELSGEDLSKLTGEELSKVFSSLPRSITHLDLSGVSTSVVQDIKQTLDDAGITVEGQKKSEEYSGPR